MKGSASMNPSDLSTVKEPLAWVVIKWSLSAEDVIHMPIIQIPFVLIPQ